MAQNGGAGHMLQKNMTAQNKSEGSMGLPHDGQAFWCLPLSCANLGPLSVVGSFCWPLEFVGAVQILSLCVDMGGA